MAQKFIINNGNLVFGDVELHRDLLDDHSKTKGGGWWAIDRENDIIYLYNRSIDFGQAKREDVIDALENGLVSPRVQDMTFIHSYEEGFTDAREDKRSVTIKVPEENKM